MAARSPDEPPARAALTELCGIYWHPVYSLIRRRGRTHHDAQELTQEFFAKLLEQNAFARVDPTKGRFRSFLQAACLHFLANEHDRATAAKRGGGRKPLPIDFGEADDRYNREPAHDLTPERLFERRWALTLLELVLNRLAEEQARAGKTRQFELLKSGLTADPAASYAETAAQLGMSEGAVKVAVHRLRRRYRALLREEIGQTLADEGDVDDEIRALFEALAPN